MATLTYKPVLYLVPAFDATKDFTFSFTYSYGSLQDNTILIKDNSNNNEIYRNKVITKQLRQVVPANTLSNGKVYTVQIQVTDANGDISAFSDPIIIYCFTEPEFSFTNISNEQTITSSYYKFNLSYTQIEDELLNQYTIILYNGNKTEIVNTGSLYNVDDLSYTFYNLINKDFYYIRAIGTTVHNMTIDTGYIYFNILYETPPVQTLLGLENLPSAGAVRISPNIRVVGATSNPTTPIYINESKVDLTSDGSYVKFEDGFSIINDFLIQAIGENMIENSTVMVLDNNINQIIVNFRTGKFEGQETIMAYFELKVYNSLTNYYLTSNYFPVPSSSNQVYFWIRRVGSRYEIKAEIL
ncbi:MAG: hypothetical protein ACI4SM_00175 [Candidatus Gastranaerophilaceae bacterium]